MNSTILKSAISHGEIKTFGDSMFPLLRDGDVVSIKKTIYSQIKVNDIVCFRQKNNLVTHRVVYKTATYIIAKGDNNPFSDGKVRPDKILGRVNAIKRDGQSLNIDDFYLFQSSIYFGEIKRIVGILSKEKNDIVLLKGLPLHLYLEKKHPRRIYADCDILVAKKDASRAKKVLVNEGYKLLDFSLSKEHRKLKEKIVEESYGKEVDGLPVIFDIHYEAAFMMTQLGSLNFLYPQKLLDSFTSHLLDDKRMVTIEKEEFPLLSLEDQIVYLFLHLFHHNFRGGYRYDILVRILDLKYEKNKLIKLIREYQLTNFVYAGLILLQEYYPSKKYKEILDRLSVSQTVKQYVEKKVLPIKIFDDEERVGGGVNRFLLLFYLSPEPFIFRFMTFFNSQVIYSIWWVLSNKIRKITVQHFPFSRGLLQSKS
ncbi:MAG: signal peptidase I [Candidatus Levybacteria bacterium]|nr:signal peptidase I [Candidatus Levybacteria bacterium]